MTQHVHITAEGTKALVYLDEHGHVRHDGALRGLDDFLNGNVPVADTDGHVRHPRDGVRFLHALVHKLDRATLMHAKFCEKPDCLHHLHGKLI